MASEGSEGSVNSFSTDFGLSNQPDSMEFEGSPHSFPSFPTYSGLPRKPEFRSHFFRGIKMMSWPWVSSLLALTQALSQPKLAVYGLTCLALVISSGVVCALLVPTFMTSVVNPTTRFHIRCAVVWMYVSGVHAWVLSLVLLAASFHAIFITTVIQAFLVCTLVANCVFVYLTCDNDMLHTVGGAANQILAHFGLKNSVDSVDSVELEELEFVSAPSDVLLSPDRDEVLSNPVEVTPAAG